MARLYLTNVLIFSHTCKVDDVSHVDSRGIEKKGRGGKYNESARARALYAESELLLNACFYFPELKFEAANALFSFVFVSFVSAAF